MPTMRDFVRYETDLWAELYHPNIIKIFRRYENPYIGPLVPKEMLDKIQFKD